MKLKAYIKKPLKSNFFQKALNTSAASKIYTTLGLTKAQDTPYLIDFTGICTSPI